MIDFKLKDEKIEKVPEFMRRSIKYNISSKSSLKKTT